MRCTVEKSGSAASSARFSSLVHIFLWSRTGPVQKCGKAGVRTYHRNNGGSESLKSREPQSCHSTCKNLLLMYKRLTLSSIFSKTFMRATNDDE